MWTAEDSGYLQARHREAEDSPRRWDQRHGREGEGSVMESTERSISRSEDKIRSEKLTLDLAMSRSLETLTVAMSQHSGDKTPTE